MDVFETIKERHSVREFADKKVAWDDVCKLIESARLAPSACNLQLTEYIAVDDDALIGELRRKVSDKFSWAPDFIVVVYDPRFTKHRHADAESAGMAVQNILLAATAMGIGACPIAGFDNDKTLKQILNIPQLYKIALIIAFGYEKEKNKKDGERLPVERIMHKNTYKKEGSPLNASINILNCAAADVIDYRRRIAPVYLYKNHYRLGTFAPEVYGEAAKIFEPLLEKDGEAEVLDLFSYDMEFARALIKLIESKDRKINISVSDYLPYILKIAREQHAQIKTVEIGADNAIFAADKSADIITCVNKLEFTPDINKILNEVKRILKPKGKLWFVNFSESFLSRFTRFAYQKFSNANVYCGNQFYKIGPYHLYGINKTRKMIEKFGFKNTEFKNIVNFGKYKFYLSIFENAD